MTGFPVLLLASFIEGVMKKLHFLYLLLATLLLGACSSTQVTLPYVAPASVARAGATVEIGSVDDRRENSPNRLGAIRGGYGNPLKYLDTAVPVKDMVRDAFIDGLKARAAYADVSPFIMSIVINRLDCSQYVRREAHANFHVRLVSKASGAEVYQKTTSVDLEDGSAFALDAGIFGSVEDLRVVLNRALQQAIDQALDDPGLLAVLK